MAKGKGAKKGKKKEGRGKREEKIGKKGREGIEKNIPRNKFLVRCTE